MSDSLQALFRPNGLAVIGGSFGSASVASIVNTFTGGVYVGMGELRVNGSSVPGGNGAGDVRAVPVIVVRGLAGADTVLAVHGVQVRMR